MTPVDGATLELQSWNPEATRQLAGRLAALAEPGDILCLWGDLGAGKTVFAKGFGLGLGIDATISSPTFVLMGEYAGRLPLFHIDLYRLASARDALDGGLLDDRQAAGVVLVEWPDRLGDALPPDRLDVHIDADVEEPRRIRLTAQGAGYGRYVESARGLEDARSAAPQPGTARAPTSPSDVQ
jgi:tRNA threonylcarbamoyladenosine biosynthesis protein TsaE